ncbi:hypothetical protein C8N46_10133 [Kordia periserrulae]|uniref:Uncharacterized protein n=1 Tax=Kordia periserrulae TaxID=701523 RepID=A0A2T6C560_9FLAO|nr:hypothetical protein [Kordia periserrulae]PTX63433.1 hypothetical protein C8N46_10133 [Kordia periserrulae]
MKKRNLQTIKLNKQTISTLDTAIVFGGFRSPAEEKSEVSKCNAGTNRVCCA